MGRISIHVVQAEFVLCFIWSRALSDIFPALVQQTAVQFNIEFVSPWNNVS